MDIKMDWEKYAKKSLKRMEKELKAAEKNNEEWKIEDFKRDIERHKEEYSEYLKK